MVNAVYSSLSKLLVEVITICLGTDMQQVLIQIHMKG